MLNAIQKHTQFDAIRGFRQHPVNEIEDSAMLDEVELDAVA